VIETTIAVGGRSVRLVRPSDPDRLLDDPDVLARNRRDDYMPYWAYLWPGAYLLAEAVGRSAWPAGLRALEIGCGLGLAGLIGIASGLRVTFTDYDEAPLRFVRRSAQANGFGSDRFEARWIDWRDLPDERFSLILGADVLYEPGLVPLVTDVLVRMLAPDGEALLAGPYRVATEDAESTFSARGLRSLAEPIVAKDEAGDLVRGTLHRVRRT
jgi:predicted nicotinamide N-methyase